MRKLLGIVFAGVALFCVLSASPSRAEAAGWYNCQAMDVFEYSNNNTPLLMVECSNTYATGVNWTAIQLSTATAGQASRFTAMAEAAVLSGRKFRVYMSDTVCPNNSNCRIATNWGLYSL